MEQKLSAPGFGDDNMALECYSPIFGDKTEITVQPYILQMQGAHATNSPLPSWPTTSWRSSAYCDSMTMLCNIGITELNYGLQYLRKACIVPTR